ncbi:DUF6446 family protein [Paracoccus aerodenitrificans]|uniref:DUF6446 family protein n=1 Tax=Paracoccus aerodenitrificans TaxID=3017781 RepID=UPI0022F0CB96|nr:DUF6446 family protein [Paracoccus aerodenitrificans]WBU65395.1 DUF6446 family protein [Paracoccus aerodenitrificans]
MTTGKILASMIVLSAILAGAAVYYLQVYGFYDPVDEIAGAQEIQIVTTDGRAEAIAVSDFRGIDADSSPLRYRSCFVLDDGASVENAAAYDGPTPLVGPNWFNCYSAKALTADLESGAARAYLVQPDIETGVDRVMAVYPDGRAFAWHQLNDSAEESRTIE